MINKEEIKRTILAHIRKRRFLSKTNFVILFGSVHKNTATPMSDIDICISCNLPRLARQQERIKLQGELSDKFDIQIFEDLPSYIQVEVLTGSILYVKNRNKLHDVAIKTIQEYEDFQPAYEYLISPKKKRLET